LYLKLYYGKLNLLHIVNKYLCERDKIRFLPDRRDSLRLLSIAIVKFLLNQV